MGWVGFYARYDSLAKSKLIFVAATILVAANFGLAVKVVAAGLKQLIKFLKLKLKSG
jgi:hypothetical protein